MHRRNLLFLVVVAFAAFASDVTYAKNAIRTTDNGNSDTTHRNLMTNAAIVDAAGAEDEERGLNIKMPSFVTKIFRRNPKVSTAVKNSPDIAKGLKDPKVGQTVKELEGNKGLADHFLGLPVIRSIAERVKGKSLTTNNVKELGAAAMKSSGTWKKTLEHLWDKHGTGFLFGLGIFFLFYCVYHGIYG